MEAKIKELEERVQELEEENEMNIAQIEEQAEMYQAKEAECEELRAQLEKAPTATAAGPCEECPRLREQLTCKDAALKDHEQTIAQLREKTQQLEMLDKQLGQAKAELASVQQEAGNAKVAYVEQLATEKQNSKELAQRVEDLTSKNEALAADVARLTKGATQEEVFIQQIQGLRQQLADQMISKEQLQEELSTQKKFLEKKTKEAEAKESQLKDIIQEKDERLKAAIRVNELETKQANELKTKLDEALALNFELQKHAAK